MRKARKLLQLRTKLSAAPTILDVGGANNSPKERSYRECWPEAAYYWVADIARGPNVTHHMTSPYRIDLEDAAVDLVVSGQTLEHVGNPFRLVAEMMRVLRPGGGIVLIAPSAGYMHGDQDCWRFMRDAYRAIAQECRIETIADWIYEGDSGEDRGRLWDDHVFVGYKP